MEIDGFEIFNADTTDGTKICHDKTYPLILSGQFLFCPQVQKGPKPQKLFISCVLGSIMYMKKLPASH